MNTIFKKWDKGQDKRTANCLPPISPAVAGNKRGRIVYVILACFAFVFTACQGPWDYFPEKKTVYKGVYIFGHIIADQPVKNVCLQRVLELDESRSDNFSYYDSASMKISGNFSGKDTVITLSAQNTKPACFDGAQDMIPARGNQYTLNADLWWDSAGTSVKSHYEAEASIPSEFSIQKLVAQKALKMPYENVPEGSLRTYWNFPFDMGAYYFIPHYSADVRGVVTYMQYENRTGGESIKNSINQMLSSFMDGDDYILVFTYRDSVQLLDFTENTSIGGINMMDSIPIMNIMLPMGKLEFYFYATDQAYVDYQTTILRGLDDPRIIPLSNVKGGNGFFTGMAPDTFRLEMKIEDPKDYRSYAERFVKDCRETDCPDCPKTPWSSHECRTHIDAICADSSYTMKDCGVPAVKNALLEGKNWDALLPDTLSDSVKTSFYHEGLQKYCVQNNFQNSDSNSCEPFYTACIEDEALNACKESLWEWCGDNDWDMQKNPQCGSAIVSRYRLEKLKSDAIRKFVGMWCETASEPQCKY
ncbi:MAG: hypothetical protein LBR60_03780 [Fibrobacter sp.]|jgi:hypothetical protein|nr:hypothetical protein [Fibrobacter sp.]